MAQLQAIDISALSSLILLMLGWLFVPFYIRTNAHTIPAFLKKGIVHPSTGSLASFEAGKKEETEK